MNRNQILRFKDAKTLTRISLSSGFFIISLIVLNRIIPTNKIFVIASLITAFLTYGIVKPRVPLKPKKITNSRPSYWVFVLSILIGLFSVFRLIENANFELMNFSQRTIGIAVLEGLDISSRSFFYILAVFLFTTIFVISSTVYSQLDYYISNYFNPGSVAREKKVFLYLSLLSIFTLIFHYLKGSIIYINIFDILLLLIFLNYLIFLAKVYFISQKESLFRILNNYNLVVLSFLSPVAVFFIRWVLVNGSFIFSYKYIFPYLAIWMLFWLIVYLITKSFPEKRTKTLISAILSSAIPFLLIPISIPLSNEVQFSLSSFTNTSALSLSRFIVLILLGASVFNFLGKLKQTKWQNNRRYAEHYYLPIFLATLVMFTVHKNFIELPSHLDMFHHGENLLSTQQLFSFGRIPFIHLYPTHGVSYLFGQVFFSLVNGYRPFEPWLWEWVVKIFEVLLLYYILKKITKSSFFSATIIAFIPVLGIFGGEQFIYGYNTSLAVTYYFSSFLIALSLAWTLKKLSYRRLKIHWLLCFSLIAWRVDFGLSSLATSILIFFVILIAKKFLNLKTKLTLKHVVKSFAFITGVFIFLFIILTLAAGASPLNIINQILHFVRIQTAAQGLVKVSTSIAPLTMIQYFILPAIAVFYLAFFVISAANKTLGRFDQSRWILLFLAVFSLIISVRSVQRQTLAVLGYNPYLFIFLGLCLPYYLKIKKEFSIILFVLMFLGYQLVFPSNTLLLETGRIINLYNWRNKETRVRVNDAQYKNLSDFLNDNLGPKQTFLDFTSSPMLYVTTNKRFINYFIPSAYYTSEPIQKHILSNIENAYREGEIPIVIFRQPNEYANNIDGVPNEIRSYRIYEFIYKNYKPAGYVNGFMIWSANNYDLVKLNDLVPFENFSQEFNLKMLPYFWANFDKYRAKENTEIISVLIKEITTTNNPVKLQFNDNIDKSSGNYLDLRVKANEPGSLKIIYGKNPSSSVTMDLLATGKEENYLIRISSQWRWMSQSIETINVSTTNNAEIVQAYLRKGD